MANCLKKDGRGNLKSNHLLLERRAPGYWEWFERMRKIRNELKRGLNAASDWTADEHMILLSEHFPDGDFVGHKNVRSLSLEFAAECLSMCAAATIAVRAELVSVCKATPAVPQALPSFPESHSFIAIRRCHRPRDIYRPSSAVHSAPFH